MTRDELIELIEAIVAFQPKEEWDGNIGHWPSWVEPFGYYFYGVGEFWEWFDNRVPDYQGHVLRPGHRYLQDASDDELADLLTRLQGQAS